MSGGTTDSATEHPGTTVDSAPLTVQRGDAAGTAMLGRRAAEESSEGNSAATTEVPSVIETGTAVKEVPG